MFEEIAGRDAITGEEAFTLAATYGFPIELTVELAEERGQPVDVDGYREAMARHREISKAGGDTSVAQAGEFNRTTDFATEFVGYEKTDVRTQVGAVADAGEGRFLAKLRESPFYAAGGGQVSDAGWIEREDGTRAELVEAFRLGDDQVLLFAGDGFAAGDRVHAVVPWPVRFPTMANHTATHLLHRALRDVLGEHVRQAGSAVRPDKLRFDFTHEQALTPEQREEVERRVNEQVFRNLPVRAFETTREEAEKLGATMLFGEKYGDVVRVVEVDGYSRELCGGTHVRATAEIGPFAILTEGSVGSGARRIEAVTAGEAYAYLHGRSRELDDLRAEIERLRRDAKKKPAAAADGGPKYEITRQTDAAGAHVLVVEVETGDPLDVSDRLKQQHAPAAVIVGARSNGDVQLVINVDPSLEGRGVHAGNVIREAAAVVGGGGGGRPTMARAGGKHPEKLADALAEAERLILSALNG